MRPFPSSHVAPVLHGAVLDWLTRGMPANDSTREAACGVIATLLDDLEAWQQIVFQLLDGDACGDGATVVAPRQGAECFVADSLSTPCRGSSFSDHLFASLPPTATKHDTGERT